MMWAAFLIYDISPEDSEALACIAVARVPGGEESMGRLIGVK